MRTWILVGDGARARVFEWRSRTEPPLLLHDLRHPESRAKADELYTDMPTMDSGTPAREGQSKVFAHQLGELLDRELSTRHYEELILIAPPQFLGLLRQELTRQVQHRVKREIAKDLSAVSENELVERLGPV